MSSYAAVRQLSTCSEGGLAEEVEMLQNIYTPEELRVNALDSGATEVCVHITPSTGGDMDKKYLYLDLHLIVGTKYPKEAAVISLRSSRGLSDARLCHISSSLAEKAAELQGGVMLFELLEHAKDCLTEQNLPSDQCPICLLHFQEEDECTRTDCYHYYHVSCLACYIKSVETEQSEELDYRALDHRTLEQGLLEQEKRSNLICPVCREVLEADSSCLAAVAQATPPPDHPKAETEAIYITPDIRHWQKEMAILLEQQRLKGGLIDLSAKDEVIDETWVRPKQTVADASNSSANGDENEGNKNEEKKKTEENMLGAKMEKMMIGQCHRERRNATGKPANDRRHRTSDELGEGPPRHWRNSDEHESWRRRTDKVGSPGERQKERRKCDRHYQTHSRGGGRSPRGRADLRDEGVKCRDRDRDQHSSGTNYKYSGAQQKNRRRERSKRKSMEEARDRATEEGSSEGNVSILQTPLKHLQLSSQPETMEQASVLPRVRIKQREKRTKEETTKMTQTAARSPREAGHDREHQTKEMKIIPDSSVAPSDT